MLSSKNIKNFHRHNGSIAFFERKAFNQYLECLFGNKFATVQDENISSAKNYFIVNIYYV